MRQLVDVVNVNGDAIRNLIYKCIKYMFMMHGTNFPLIELHTFVHNFPFFE